MKLIEIGEYNRDYNFVEYDNKIEHLIRGDTLIGRDEEKFLSFEMLKTKYIFLKINHKAVSRLHAIIFERDNSWWMEDIGTANGIWLINNIEMSLKGKNLIQSKPGNPLKIQAGDYVLIAFFVLIKFAD